LWGWWFVGGLRRLPLEPLAGANQSQREGTHE
jgi:hypothetical protein